MKNERVKAAPYLFSDVDQLTFGRFPVLDTVMQRWARRMEDTLFERYQFELYAGVSTVQELKFGQFFASLRYARPIYFFEMLPLQGSGLLVLDDRLPALVLAPERSRDAPTEAMRQGTAPQGGFVRYLHAANQLRLQRVVQTLLHDLDRAWADVHRVETRIRRLTTHLFRARLLHPHERCLTVQVHFSGKQGTASLRWCVPSVLLDPVLPERRNGPPREIPPLTRGQTPFPLADPGERVGRLLRRTRYPLRVTLDGPRLDAGTALRVGTVLPLGVSMPSSPLRARLELADTVLLEGTPGVFEGRRAFEVFGAPRQQEAVPSRTDPFRPLIGPSR